MDVYEFLDKLNLKRTNKKVDELHDRLSKICENLIKTFELNNVSVIYDKNFKYGDRHHRVIYLQDIFEIKIDGKFYYADLEIVIRSDNHNRIFFDIEKIVSEDVEYNYKIDDALDKVFIDCCYKKYAEISKQLWLMNSEDLYNKTYFDFDYYDRKKDINDMDYNSVVLLLTEIYKEARKLRGLNYGKN